MIDDPPAAQRAEEPLDLTDRDGIAHAHIHPAPFLERAAAVDADQAALGVEQRAARIARIDGSVGLDAVGVFQEGPGRRLVAVDPGNDAIGHRRLQIGSQQEGVAHDKDPVAQSHGVGVAHFGRGKFRASDELDQGHVAGGVETDDHGVVELAVGHAALHRQAAGGDNVEVRQGVAIG